MAGERRKMIKRAVKKRRKSKFLKVFLFYKNVVKFYSRTNGGNI